MSTSAERPQFFFFTPVLGGPGAPRYPIGERRQIIGRSEEAEIALLEPTVSRRHAAVNSVDGEVWLEDLQSKHGTFVNSRRVQRTRLKVGDIVVFGLSIVLRLEVTDHAIPPAMPLRMRGLVKTPLNTPNNLEREQPTHFPFPNMLGRGTLARDGGLPPGDQQELRRLRGEVNRLRQLAGVGFFCLNTLPGVARRLDEVKTLLVEGEGQPRGAVDLEGVRQGLRQVSHGLERVVSAVNRLPPPRLQTTRVAMVVQQAIEEVTAANTGESLEIQCQVEEDLTVQAAPQQLTTAVAALLLSATRQSLPGAPVTVQASASVHGVLLRVQYQGSAGPLARRETAVGPDPRLGLPGPDDLGLGYFEALQTIMSFGGTLTVESTDPNHVAFDARLPPPSA